MRKRSQKEQNQQSKDKRLETVVYFWTQKEEDFIWATFQIETLSKKDLNRALNEIGGSPSGEGIDPSTGKMIVLVRKRFENSKVFTKFNKNLDLKTKRVKN